MTRICRECKRTLPDEYFYPSNLRNKKYVCRDCSTKMFKYDPEFYTGGWKIIYLNRVKKNEYKFQATNTDGRHYETNDIEQMKIALKEIFNDIIKE